jgi:hypothetical protein
MLLTICIVVTVVVLSLIVLPFFVGQGGALQSASAVHSVDQLDGMRHAILERYLEDEQAFEKQLMSKSVWENRKLFLTHRYIDVVRRLDFLKASQGVQGEKA